MIDRAEKKECNGCKLCKDIWLTEAISYAVGNQGFWYPTIDHGECVFCGQCVLRCPNLHPIISRTRKAKVFAAWSKDKNIRLASTSGGIFYELAKEVLDHGGYVTRCVYDDDFKGTHQIMIHSMEELPPLMAQNTPDYSCIERNSGYF